jgi:hypothetical protein
MYQQAGMKQLPHHLFLFFSNEKQSPKNTKQPTKYTKRRENQQPSKSGRLLCVSNCVLRRQDFFFLSWEISIIDDLFIFGMKKVDFEDGNSRASFRFFRHELSKKHVTPHDLVHRFCRIAVKWRDGFFMELLRWLLPRDMLLQSLFESDERGVSLRVDHAASSHCDQSRCGRGDLSRPSLE